MARSRQVGGRRRGRAVLTLVAALAAVLWGGSPGVAANGATATDGAPQTGPVEVTLWWGDGCPRCAEEREALDELAERLPLVVVEHEVWADAANRARFVAEGERLGFDASAVPTTVVGERVWIGYTPAIGEDLERALEAAVQGTPPPPGVYGSTGTGTCTREDLQCDAGAASPTIDVPLVGEVALDRSLLVSTLVIGFVDGVNPCSLWAISVLLTIVVRTASRRRVVAVGATFLAVTAGMYALYMAGIYSALAVVGMIGAVQVVVAVAAGLFGAVSVKDYFAFKRGISFTIADSAKPGLYRRMRDAAGQRRLVPALLATAALGVAVSLLETPCTAGFPVLWTGLLRSNGVGAAESAALFVAYMVPFLLDEVLVLVVAVTTMRAMRLQEHHGELLKLVAGVTMLALATAMVVDPALMESPAAAGVLFAAAFAVAGLVHAVTTTIRRHRVRVRTADLGVGSGPNPGASGPVAADGTEAR